MASSQPLLRFRVTCVPLHGFNLFCRMIVPIACKILPAWNCLKDANYLKQSGLFANCGG